MVGVPQEYDIGLFVTPARLMLWLAHLAGRSNAIFLDSVKKALSMRILCATYSRGCPLWSYRNLEVRPSLDDRLKARQKLDIGVKNIKENITSEVAKCISVDSPYSSLVVITPSGGFPLRKWSPTGRWPVFFPSLLFELEVLINSHIVWIRQSHQGLRL